MSSDWIKMRVDLGDDPAVIGIASKLGLSEFEVVGRLHWLWSWADRHTHDGVVTGATCEWIDRRVGQGFATAMSAVGWLSWDCDAATITFPSFSKHNGRTAKERAEDARRKAVSRSCPENIRTESGQAPDESQSRERETKAVNHLSGIGEELTPTEDARANAPALSLPRQFSLPDEWRADAQRIRSTWSDDDVLRVFLAFREHFVSVGCKRADWQAAWRKWVRQEREQAPAKAGKSATKSDRYDAIVGRGNGRKEPIEVAAERVDGGAVRPLPLGVRQQGRDDVVRGEPGRLVAGLG